MYSFLQQNKIKLLAAFTLIETIAAIALIGILFSIVVPRFSNLRSTARIAAINSLAGAVREASNNVNLLAIISRSTGGSGYTTSVLYGDANIRVWNGYADRWWDGIGNTLQGASPLGVGYLSTTPFPYNQFMFYGYGNATLPGGLCGWRIESARIPANCSVTYNNSGLGLAPIITVTTSGC